MPCKAQFGKNISLLKAGKEPSKISPWNNTKCFWKVSLHIYLFYRFMTLDPLDRELEIQLYRTKIYPQATGTKFSWFQVQLRVKLKTLALSLFCRLVFWTSFLLWICWHAFIHHQLLQVCCEISVCCVPYLLVQDLKQKTWWALIPTNVYFPCEALWFVFLILEQKLNSERNLNPSNQEF